MQKTIEELEREIADAQAVREEKVKIASKADSEANDAWAKEYALKRRLYLTRLLESDQPFGDLSIYMDGRPILTRYGVESEDV